MRRPHPIRRLYVRSGIRRILPHRVKTALRHVWLRVARLIGYPISSPLVPRPPLDPRRARMRLGRVLLACDLNRDYLDFWPAARRTWREVVGLDATLVLIADPTDVPADLTGDDAVVAFPPVSGVHTAFQAQCIRLLYAALLDVDDAVLIADVDLYPLDPSYFNDPISRLDARFFVTYRDVRLDRNEIPISYNAAAPATWAEIFGVRSIDDVRARLEGWAERGPYDGRRGWPGWYTDQQILYETLAAWPEAPSRLWTLDDVYCGFSRLDRLDLEREDGLEARRVAALRAMKYTDYNCLVPYREHEAVNELVLELALEAARARGWQRRRILARA